MSSAVDWQPEPTVIIAGDGTGFDAAARALVTSLGFDAIVVPEHDLSRHRPALVVVRDELALTRAMRAHRERAVRFAVLMAPPRAARGPHARRVRWLSGDAVAADLGRLLHSVAPDHGRAAGAVHVTFREREVVGDYVFGGKGHEVAARHHIAESTLKAHYRRVAARYAEAGRPVANKTQLLLEMLADGWLKLPER